MSRILQQRPPEYVEEQVDDLEQEENLLELATLYRQLSTCDLFPPDMDGSAAEQVTAEVHEWARGKFRQTMGQGPGPSEGGGQFSPDEVQTLRLLLREMGVEPPRAAEPPRPAPSFRPPLKRRPLLGGSQSAPMRQQTAHPRRPAPQPAAEPDPKPNKKCPDDGEIITEGTQKYLVRWRQVEPDFIPPDSKLFDIPIGDVQVIDDATYKRTAENVFFAILKRPSLTVDHVAHIPYQSTQAMQYVMAERANVAASRAPKTLAEAEEKVGGTHLYDFR